MSTLPVPVASTVNPVAAAVATGATSLLLLRDVEAIASQSRTDPFIKLLNVASFKPGEDLGWVTRYCSTSPEPPTLRFSLRISGNVNGRQVNRVAPADEMVPDSLKAAPGCYMLRGSVPLEGMAPGRYRLEISVGDLVAIAPTMLASEFLIE